MQDPKESEATELPAPGEPHLFPVLPLRDIVVFPHMIVPLFVGRQKSVRALDPDSGAPRWTVERPRASGWQALE